MIYKRKRGKNMDKETIDIQEQLKQTQREYNRQYRLNNKDKLNQYQREYRQKNKDKVKQYNKTYWLKKAKLLKN